jgi:hypothetical protein
VAVFVSRASRQGKDIAGLEAGAGVRSALRVGAELMLREECAERVAAVTGRAIDLVHDCEVVMEVVCRVAALAAEATVFVPFMARLRLVRSRCVIRLEYTVAAAQSVRGLHRARFGVEADMLCSKLDGDLGSECGNLLKAASRGI